MTVLRSGAVLFAVLLSFSADSITLAQKAQQAARVQQKSPPQPRTASKTASKPVSKEATKTKDVATDDFIPGPMAVRELRSLSDKQRRDVVSILESSGVTAVREQMFKVAKSANLPPPLPSPGDRRGPGGPGRQRSDEIGSELLAAMLDADDPNSKETSRQQTAANKKLRVLRQSLRTRWLAAWTKIKPILSSAQLEELRPGAGQRHRSSGGPPPPPR